MLITKEHSGVILCTIDLILMLKMNISIFSPKSGHGSETNSIKSVTVIENVVYSVTQRSS